MFIRCISMVLAATIFVESYFAWLPPVKPNTDIESVTQEVSEEIIVEEIDIIEAHTEPVELEEVVTVDEPIVQPETTTLPLPNNDIDLIALVTMAEAEGESDEGKRLVIDVILNRYDSPRFPNTISGVIYAKNAFECMWNGRINRCYVRDDIRQLVIEELQSRYNSNVHYFRANRYHGFGTPVVQVGNHYFSTY